MAYKHDDKSSGQLIRSADWNTMGHEIERLETDKVNRVGDTIKGDLTVTGKAQLGSLAVTGDASISGKVLGPLAVNGDVSVSGKAQLGSLAVSGDASISGKAQLGSLAVTGDAGVAGLLLGAKSSYWPHNPYADAIGPPVASFGRLEVGGFDDGSGKVPAVLRIHQWGTGAAEFYKPQGATLYLRETPGGGGNWFNTLEVSGAIRAGNSDLYFSKTNHNHTGIGNTDGWAAIENAKDFDALMILGRAHTGGRRIVKLWDYLEVNGDSVVNGVFSVNSPSGNRLVMQGDGNLVIYRSNGAAWWNTGTNISDSRLKRDIRFIERPLEKLLSVNGISFSWAEEEWGSDRELGVLADEIEKVFPELICSLDKKYKSVKYQGLIAVLIEAIKEQQATILRFGEEIQLLKGVLKPKPV